MATVTKSRSRLSKSGRPANGNGAATKSRSANGHGPGMFGRGAGSGVVGDPSAWVEAIAAHHARAERNTTVLKAVDLELGQLRPSPFQPRQSFPEDELKELAESILTHGQLVPLICRHFPGSTTDGSDYELIDGEFRWRAAKLAGVKTLRAEVGDFSDAEAAKIVLVSALSRKDLNAIEEANGFARLIAMGVASGPTELARQLGLSQGHVSNQLRLLELPDAIRRRVISREMTARHARAVVGLAKTPGLAKAVEKRIGEWLQHGELAPADRFRENLERHIVYEHTRPMTGKHYNYEWGGDASIFKPTDDQARELGIVEIEVDGKPQRRATNLRLWERLQQKHAKAHHAKREKCKPAKDADGKPKKRTPAEEARLAKEHAEQYGRWLRQYLTDVRRWILARFLRGDDLVGSPDQVQMLRVAVFFAGTKEGEAVHRFYDELRRTSDEDLATKAGQIMADWFFDKTGPRQNTTPRDVWALFSDLGLDLEPVWLAEQFGPLSPAYWARQNKERLVELATELKVSGIAASMPKGKMVSAFLAKIPGPEDKEAGISLPKEIRKCKLK
jgi:ParB/RepB/Spo0J family partition protein